MSLMPQSLAKFEAEFRTFLVRYEIAFDERYVWD